MRLFFSLDKPLEALNLLLKNQFLIKVVHYSTLSGFVLSWNNRARHSRQISMVRVVTREDLWWSFVGGSRVGLAWVVISFYLSDEVFESGLLLRNAEVAIELTIVGLFELSLMLLKFSIPCFYAFDFILEQPCSFRLWSCVVTKGEPVALLFDHALNMPLVVFQLRLRPLQVDKRVIQVGHFLPVICVVLHSILIAVELHFQLQGLVMRCFDFFGHLAQLIVPNVLTIVMGIDLLSR